MLGGQHRHLGDLLGGRLRRDMGVAMKNAPLAVMTSDSAEKSRTPGARPMISPDVAQMAHEAAFERRRSWRRHRRAAAASAAITVVLVRTIVARRIRRDAAAAGELDDRGLT